jgi:hypothetical protein
MCRLNADQLIEICCIEICIEKQQISDLPAVLLFDFAEFPGLPR